MKINHIRDRIIGSRFDDSGPTRLHLDAEVLDGNDDKEAVELLLFAFFRHPERIEINDVRIVNPIYRIRWDGANVDVELLSSDGHGGITGRIVNVTAIFWCQNCSRVELPAPGFCEGCKKRLGIHE